MPARRVPAEHRRQALWLFAFLLPWGAAALGLPGRASAPGRHAQGALPDLPTFKARWGNRHSGEAGLREPLPSGVQLVLGVMSTAGQGPYRDVIRGTWMSQRGVCPLSGGPAPGGCSVYVAFVLGARGPGGAPAEDRRMVAGPEEDVLLLNISENMNHGKTYAYFRHVVRAHPWATHVGKMDMDAYPYIHKLVTSLREPHHCKAAYIGRPWTCYHSKKCPPAGCGKPVGHDFLQYCGEGLAGQHCGMQPCWTFMQGGLYLMSRELAQGLTAAGSAWERRHQGYEDAITGRAVYSHATEHNICVSTWDPEAWDHHMRKPTPPEGSGLPGW